MVGAIGGETTGFALVSFDGTITTELDFQKEKDRSAAMIFAERKLPAGVSGTYKLVYGVEIPQRVVFMVDSLYIEE